MSVLTVAQVTRAGLALGSVTTGCSSLGDSFPTTGIEMVFIKNTGSQETITFAVQSTVDSLTVSNRNLVVPASAEMLVGPFPVSIYGDGNGRVDMTYTAAADLGVAIVQPTTN